MTSIREFASSNDLQFVPIWFYISDATGKKTPIYEKNNIKLEDIPAQKIANSQRMRELPTEVWDKVNKCNEPLSTTEYNTLVRAFSIYIKYTEDTYCVDVDEPSIKSMDDYIEYTGIDTFKDCAWIEGNTKGIHIYVKILNMIPYTDQQNCFLKWTGDLLKKNNIWEKIEKRFNNAEAGLVSFEYKDIEFIFNSKINKQLNTITSFLQPISNTVVAPATTVEAPATKFANTFAPVVELETEDEVKYGDLLFSVIKNENVPYPEWLQIIHTLKHNGFNKSVAMSYTSLYNSDTRGASAIWDGLDETKQFSLTGLDNLAKLKNPEGYKAWKMRCNKDVISTLIQNMGVEVEAVVEEAVEAVEAVEKEVVVPATVIPDIDLYTPLFTTGLIADYFKLLYEGKFVCVNDVLYAYNGIFWEREDKKGSGLIKFIDKTFTVDLLKYANNKLNHFTRLLSTTPEDEAVKTKISKVVDLLKNIRGMRNGAVRKGITDDIMTFITNNKIEFDTNPYLFAFNNCVYDLKLGKMVDPLPSSYITLTSGYDYVPSTGLQRNELNALLDTIFPDAEIKEDYMTALSTGLSGVQMEYVFIATGGGGNGKSLINSLMSKCVGGYGYKLPSSVLTQDIKQGPNPELANLHNRRFALVQEPNAEKRINTSALKELTGDDTLNVRGLYSSACAIKLTLSMFIECNELLLLNEVNDAVNRRLRIILFESKFVNQEIYDGLNADERVNVFVANPHFKTDAFKNANKSVLFDLLCERFSAFRLNKYVLKAMSAKCAARAMDYMATSDNIFSWFNEVYSKNADLATSVPISLSDVYAKFGASEYFGNMSKNDKRKYNRKHFCEKVESNLFMKRYLRLKGVYHNGNQIKGDSIVGWSINGRCNVVEDEYEEDC